MLLQETQIIRYFEYKSIRWSKRHLPGLYVPHSWSDKIPYEWSTIHTHTKTHTNYKIIQENRDTHQIDTYNQKGVKKIGF